MEQSQDVRQPTQIEWDTGNNKYINTFCYRFPSLFGILQQEKLVHHLIQIEWSDWGNKIKCCIIILKMKGKVFS